MPGGHDQQVGKHSQNIFVEWWSKECLIGFLGSGQQARDGGGLGIRPIHCFYITLLGKWIWRLGDNSDGLWKTFTISKYGLESNRCKTEVSSRRVFDFLRRVCSVTLDFEKFTSDSVVFFWTNKWWCESFLAQKLPLLFSVFSNRNAVSKTLMRSNKIMMSSAPPLLIKCRISEPFPSLLYICNPYLVDFFQLLGIALYTLAA